MKFKVFAQFVGLDWDGNPRPDPSWQYGWTDHEIIVHSNCKKNAKKKILKWARSKGARQYFIQFVSDEIWKRDKSYKTKTLK